MTDFGGILIISCRPMMQPHSVSMLPSACGLSWASLSILTNAFRRSSLSNSLCGSQSLALYA